MAPQLLAACMKILSRIDYMYGVSYKQVKWFNFCQIAGHGNAIVNDKIPQASCENLYMRAIPGGSHDLTVVTQLLT